MKNSLNNIFILFVVLVCIKTAAAQSFLNLDAAQVFSTFKFSAASNNPSLAKPVYSQISSAAFGLSYEHNYTSGLLVIGGVNVRKAGASLVYKRTNYEWNLQYVDLKFGVGYQLNKWRLKPYVSAVPFFSYLMNAKQSIGLNYFDIKATKAVKNYDYGVFMGVGFKAALSPYILIFTEYNYILGLKNIEPATGQYLYNRGFAVKLGLGFSITKFKKMQDEIERSSNTELYNSDYPENDETLNTPIPKKEAVGNVNSTSSSKENVSKPEANSIKSPGTVGWESSKSSDKTAPSEKKVPAVSNSQAQQNPSSGNNPAVVNSSVTKNNPANSSVDNKSINPANTIKENQPTVTKTASKNPVSPVAKTPLKKDITKSDANSDKNKPAVRTSAAKPATDVVFRVQLTAVKNALSKNHPLLKNIKGKVEAEKGKDGWMRYYTGSFKSYEEAHAALNKIKSKGLAEGGFVVAFKGGNKITVSEAKELVR
ncbi:MAG: SPOR domain-containing protein [Bacteroidota bacterium]